MVKGNLTDISLAGLLQLVANESHASFRIQVHRSDQTTCNLFVTNGVLKIATFGILEGIEALTEVLTWSDGEFTCEKLDPVPDKIKSNVEIKFNQTDDFTQQCNFLRRCNIGINTEIVPSLNFGTDGWQKLLFIQSLEKQDFAVLGWITDGRTMRQAMLELKLGFVESVGVLYRLVITRSVDIVRRGIPEDKDAQENLDKLIRDRLVEISSSAEAVAARKGRVVTLDTAGDEAPGGKEVQKNVYDSKTATSDASVATSTELPSVADVAEEKKQTADLKKVKTQVRARKKEGGSTSGATDGRADYDEPKPRSLKDTDTQELPTVPEEQSELMEETILESPLHKIISQEMGDDDGEPDSVSAAGENFEMKRTDPLPIVSIDIERLLSTPFSVTEKGRDILAQEDVDDLLEEVLKEIDRGKTLVLVLTDSNRSDAAIMSTYRYCFEKHYIEHHDPVMQLTIELVLTRMNLEQYLLQRRRITGEQLEELKTIAKKQGIKLSKLLVGAGFVLPADVDRLKQETDRFARD